MRIDMKRCIKMLDVRDGKILREQSLLAFLRGRRMPIWFNQEASSDVMLQLGKCAILEVAHNAPPPR
ncbi:MAG TPA: hypothetical protein VFB60_19940 [Ktedonobacteraceae bacterium]|nr:hypothetical protein [Ktedonobacteraceae bacterium]